MTIAIETFPNPTMMWLLYTRKTPAKVDLVNPKKLTPRCYWFAALSMAAIYCLIVSCVCVKKYFNFGYDDFDLAVHSQSVWALSRGGFHSSILGIPFPGNHMALILFLLAPVYLLFPSPILLLAFQSGVLAAGSLAVFLIAKHQLSERWGTAFSAIYLIYPPLILMNLYEFHPVALVATFLLFAWYFFLTDQFAPYLLFLVLAMLCQENIAMIVAAFGVYSMLKRRSWFWGWLPLLIGTIYFISVVCVIMPRLNPYIQFFSLYAHLGKNISEILKTIILHPVSTAAFMLHPFKLQFFNLLLAPLGYISLLSPLSLFPVAPVVAQRLLSARATESAMIYHYQAEFIPFVFVAAILGMKKVYSIRSATLARKLCVVLLATFPLLSFVLALVTFRFLPHTSRNRDVISLQWQILQSLKANDSVISTFEFLAPLANRQNIYSLHHIYKGAYTLSSIPYPTPDRIDVILMNTDDFLTFHTRAFYGQDHYARLQSLLPGRSWKLLAHLDPFLALRAEDAASDSRLNLVSVCDSLPHCSRRIKQDGNAPVLLRGFSISRQNGNDICDIILYWEKRDKHASEFTAITELTDRGNTIWSGRLAPGSRIWPPQSWPCGRIISDRHRVRPQSSPEEYPDLELHVISEPMF